MIPRTAKTPLVGLCLAATLVAMVPVSQAAEEQATSETARSAAAEPTEQAVSNFERLVERPIERVTSVAVTAASTATNTAVDAATAATAAVFSVATTLFQTGRVSFYADKFHGRPTASGAIYDAEEMTMAHRTLPLGTKVMITNTVNQRSVVVTVNDRGPFIGGRVGDLSRAAAEKLNMIRTGIVEATLHILPSSPSKQDAKGGNKAR